MSSSPYLRSIKTNTFNLKLLLLSALCCQIWSCNSIKDQKTTTDNLTTDVKTESFSDETVKIDLVPETEPGHYSVRIKWPKSNYPVVITENQKEIYKTKIQTEFSKVYTKNQKLSFIISEKPANSESINSYTKEILIPEDMSLSNVTTLTEPLKFKGGRFFLQNHATLIAQDKNIDMEVDEFVSDQATIQDYPLNTKATFEKNGRSAGNISIKTKIATGKLAIIANAEDGGDGRSSMCWTATAVKIRCNAASGGNGGSLGTFIFTAEDSTAFEITANKIKSSGGAAGIACKYDLSTYTSMPPGSVIISAEGTNCMGFGVGQSNGTEGKPGDGQICLKLSKDSKYDCN